MAKLDILEEMVEKATGGDVEPKNETEALKMLSEAGMGGAGVTSWNDLTDKPFGEEVMQLPLIPEETFVQNQRGGVSLSATKPEMMTSGETYTVVFDGIEYPCVCSIYNGMGGAVYQLGNKSILASGYEDTGEPFWLEISAYNGIPNVYVGSAEYGVEHTIGIPNPTVEGVVVIPLEEKYLPPTSKGDFIVKITDLGTNGYTADKTTSEIYNAALEGKNVKAVFDNGNGTLYILPLITASDYGSDFSGITAHAIDSYKITIITVLPDSISVQSAYPDIEFVDGM